MVSPETRAKYTPSIGIECHVQLKTKTKLFAAVGNDARGAPPNTLISFICLGMPGALPVLNEKVLEYAMRVAFAFHTKPQKYSYFERKHYFYPDLPKGYQITQLAKPIIVGGTVSFRVDGEEKTVRINRVQIEEDAGKSTHPAGKDYSLVDLNRAGTPLLEIVSEADMHSAAEAKAYARELYLLVRYAGVSDANLFYGNMRFDVNVSVSKDPKKLGLRTETKNLNSFRSVEKAVEYEINRQIEQLEKGQKVVQETRGWDDAKQKTFSQRSKEDAHDYRYFPDSDLPPIELSDSMIAEVEKSMPDMPDTYRALFDQLGLEQASVETLVGVPENARFVKSVLDAHGAEHARRVANWLVNVTPPSDENEAQIKHKASIEGTIKLSGMVSGKKLSSTAAKEIWTEMFTRGGDPEELAAKKNLLQVSDEGEIAKIVEQVLTDNPKAAEDVKNGEMKAIGFLVGQVMKASKGKANPALAQDFVKKQLGV